MAYDGILMSALKVDLKNKIINSKLDKIHQPENNELVMQLRGKNGKHKLYISVNSSMPHITLIKEKRENPLKPPMFSMLLRKLLLNGTITNVEQVGHERIMKFFIDSRNELGDMISYTLIVEIMGKHSNIILIDTKTQIILESIKRISISQSRVRPIFPGLKYEVIPSEKININNLTLDNFKLYLSKNKNLPIFKFLYINIEGFSPILSKSIVNSVDLEPNFKTDELTDLEIKRLFASLSDMNKKINSNEFSPNTVVEKATGKYIELSAFPISMYKNQGDYLIENNNIITVINDFYQKREVVNRFLQKSQILRKLISQKIDKAVNKLSNLENDLFSAEKADIYKIQGELILANIYNIEKGMNEIKVNNYYAEKKEEIVIKLDVRYTPSVNAQKFFKKYNKLKTAQTKVKFQIDETKKEISYLENVLTNLENTTDSQNIDEIKEELQLSGILRKKKYEKNKNKKKRKSSPNKYISRDGFEIFAGKNNVQNDQLTLKDSSKLDIWMHTKIIPGSHVIIKTDGKEVPESTIYDGAIVAAYHSKGKNSSQVPVDYTIVKNVSKPSGAKPGMVIYVKNKTIYVTPTENEINKLLIKN